MRPAIGSAERQSMRRLAFAVAGVLALSPFIALASVSSPASAAVQHPAAAEATCVDQSSPYNVISGTDRYLYADGTAAGTGVFTNSTQTSDEDWCYQSGNVVGDVTYFMMRLQGTDMCAEYDQSGGGVVNLASCDVSKLAQNWSTRPVILGSTALLTNEQLGDSGSSCLTSDKGSLEDVYMVTPDPGGCTGSGGQTWDAVFLGEPGAQ
jgi:hypothetical protein